MRRADGQVVQLPELLYRLVEQVDGRAGYDELAQRFGEASGRGIDADGVRMLVEEKLQPLGVLAGEDGTEPQLQKVDPLLALRFKAGVVPERATWALTSIFRPLFFPPVVLAVVAGLLALDGWLFLSHGIAAGARELLYAPALLLMLFGAVVLATAFHETGHATACRYGGAKPGRMGVGLYVIWPVFYTDVTDAYRLDRRGRLRTDLGGIYFNAIFALVTAAVYFATGFEPLLLIVLIQNFAMVQQLMPFLRLDGYYVISDLTGVPDMLSRIRPTLRSLIPGRRMDERVAELKPWVRRVVAVYVAILIPLVTLLFVLMLIQAPRVFATAWDSAGLQWDRASSAFDHSNTLTGIGSLLQMAALVLPAVGIALTTARVAGRGGRSAWGWSAGRPVRRAVVVAGATLAAGFAAFILWPNGEYRPIQPGERGTLAGAVSSLGAVPSGRPALTAQRERELNGAPARHDPRAAASGPASAASESAPADAEESGQAPSEEAPATPEQTPAEPAPTEQAPADSQPVDPAAEADPAAPPAGGTYEAPPPADPGTEPPPPQEPLP